MIRDFQDLPIPEYLRWADTVLIASVGGMPDHVLHSAAMLLSSLPMGPIGNAARAELDRRARMEAES